MALKRQYLRPYQAQGICAWQESGSSATVMVLPTGAGKTSIASSCLSDQMNVCGRGIMLAHRNELIDQAAQRLCQYGVESEIVRGADSGIDWTRPMLTGTVQTLIRRLERLANWARGEDVLVFSDETHRVLGPTQRTVINTIRGVAKRFRLIGLTATPYRLDGQGLGVDYGGVFDNLIEAVTPTFLFDNGQCSNCKTEHVRGALCCGMIVRSYLMRPRLFQGQAVDTTGIKAVGGDFDHGEVERRSTSIKLVGDIVDQYRRLADGRIGVTFAVGVKHANMISDSFNTGFVSGPSFTGQVKICDVVTGETDAMERDLILSKLAIGDLKMVVNCGVLCLDEQTEILTDRGWARHDTIKATDKVANWDNGRVFFEEPSAIHHRPRAVGENMVSLQCERISVRVTEGHRMVYRTHRKGLWLKTKAANVIGRSLSMPVNGMADPVVFTATGMDNEFARTKDSRRRLLIRTRYNLRTREGYTREDAVAEAIRRVDRKIALRRKLPHELTLDECRFIGFWIGDGSVCDLQTGGREYTIAQSHRYTHIIKWIRDLIERMGLHSIERDHDPPMPTMVAGRVVQTENKSRTWSFPRGTGGGSQEREGLYLLEPYLNKSGTPLFWGLSREQFLALLEGYWYADGHHGTAEHGPSQTRAWRIVGGRLECLDLLQSIAVCRGMKATVRKDGPQKPGYAQLYELSVNKNVDQFIARHRFKAETEHKNENVWCVTVRSGNIITRRGGTVLVMGNCEGWDPESDFERALRNRGLWRWNASRTQRVEPKYVPLTVAIDACPTQSMGKFMQGPIGRNTRNHPDKDEALYLGHADNIDRHCQPDQHHGFDLSGFIEKKDKNQGAAKKSVAEAIVVCTACFSTWPGGTVTCKDCGRDLSKGRKIETVQGDLHEVKHKIGDGLSAGEKTTAAKETKFREWVAECRRNNQAPTIADRRFKDQFAAWPERGMKERVYREFGFSRYLFGA